MTPATTEPARNKVKVVVRHSRECKFKGMDVTEKKCDCPKSLLIYLSAKKKNHIESAHTRVWAKAEHTAQELRDSWDPQTAGNQTAEG